MPKYILTLKFNKFSKMEKTIEAQDTRELEKKIEDNWFLRKHRPRMTIKPDEATL